LGKIFEGYSHYHRSQDSPVPLVVAGADCESLRQVYSLDQTDFGQDVLFTGWINQEDFPAVYNSASLFLYPSNLEAFPVPITEALACGTPIITADANGLKEIAGDAACFVNPHSGDEIGNAINLLFANPDLRRELSLKALARSKRFSWDACAKKLVSLFETLNSEPIVSCGR
jgi:glycosyltransferase involved in cell wall biosynthesis